MPRICHAIIFAVVAYMSSAAPSYASTYFVADTNNVLWDVDADTGVASQVGNMGLLMRDIAVSPSGQLFGVSETENLYTIDPTTAGISLVGSLGVTLASGLDFRNDGTLFLATSPTATDGNLYTVDTGSGAATLIGGIGFSSDGDLAFSPSGQLYLAAQGGSLVEVDPSTGAGSLVGSHGAGNLNAMDFIGSQLIGVNAAGQVYELNTSTGLGTFLVNTSPNVPSAGATYLIPEPTAIALISASLLGMGLCRRR